MTIHCLDANIFLEISLEPEDDGDKCEKIFSKTCIRSTSSRILQEVDDNFNLITKVLQFDF